MENYKKKYEEALERAKVVNPGTIDYNIVTEIFPELKESEEKKIVKSLINYFSEQDEILTAIDGSVKVGDIIAWLEKQGNFEVKDVDLEKELIEWHKEHFKKDGTFIGMSGFYLTNNSQMDIAKHFFELGLETQKRV